LEFTHVGIVKIVGTKVRFPEERIKILQGRPSIN
jgi:hypothetical protein